MQPTASRTHHADIRIGTLVSADAGHADQVIRELTPHGFESFSITFWKTLGGADPGRLAERVRAALAGSGAIVSSLSIFGNPLGDGDEDAATRRAWEALIDHAADFGCALVTGFSGRVRGAPVPDSLPRLAEVFRPLLDRAAAKGVRLAFENCPMGGTWAAGDWNIAFNPAAWELIFERLPDAHLGLQWEPCHQICQHIDPLPQLRTWMGRIFAVHGKDATVHCDVLASRGDRSPEAWVHHRHPGFGDSDWRAIIDRLRLAGWRGCIDIEGWHDPVYRGDLEYTGQVAALRHLKACRGGDWIAAPQGA